MYLLIRIIFFNNFLLTRQRLKTTFLIFLVLVKEQICFRCCTEPTTDVARPRFIRIANNANPSFLVSFFDPEYSRFVINQFLMPKV